MIIMRWRIDRFMSNSSSWDDWRIVDAIARTGTTAAAADLLGYNQSTVFRRITQLEETLGVRLFERDKRGFRLTPQGETLLPSLDQMSEIASDIERRVLGLDQRVEGEVKLSVNGSIAKWLLAESLKQFRERYPDITLNLDVTDRVVNIKEREADLVIRGSNDPDPDLFGRKITRLPYAIYTSAEWADANMQKKALSIDPTQLEWIGLSENLAGTAPELWIRKNLKGIRFKVVASTIEAVADLSAAGHGCCVIPVYIGDAREDVTRISDDVPGLYTQMWVLTHQDLRKTARVSALMRFIADKNVHR